MFTTILLWLIFQIYSIKVFQYFLFVWCCLACFAQCDICNWVCVSEVHRYILYFWDPHCCEDKIAFLHEYCSSDSTNSYGTCWKNEKQAMQNGASVMQSLSQSQHKRLHSSRPSCDNQSKCDLCHISGPFHLSCDGQNVMMNANGKPKVMDIEPMDNQPQEVLPFLQQSWISNTSFYEPTLRELVLIRLSFLFSLHRRVPLPSTSDGI